jgi:hypothetical protein
MAKSLLYGHYFTLKKLLKKSFYCDYAVDNVYQCYIVAAYSKCFQFNLTVNNYNPKNSFFFTPSLRGICEDFIMLKFLKKYPVIDKNELLQSYSMYQLMEIVAIQDKFFCKNHKQQIVYRMPELEKVQEENLNKIKAEWGKIGLNKDKVLPTVSHMATDAGLVELYEYLYSATSDMVHFSPHNLMRSGWSKKETPYHHHFDVQNFHKYYNTFNHFYGSYLFVLFSKVFKKELNLGKDALEKVKEIESDIFDTARWPELVTFEEMNVPQAEAIRLINTIRKLKLTANKFNIPEDQFKEDIKEFLKKVSVASGSTK